VDSVLPDLGVDGPQEEEEEEDTPQWGVNCTHDGEGERQQIV